MTRKSGHHIITVVDDHDFQTVLEKICNASVYKNSLLMHISSLKILKEVY